VNGGADKDDVLGGEGDAGNDHLIIESSGDYFGDAGTDVADYANFSTGVRVLAGQPAQRSSPADLRRLDRLPGRGHPQCPLRRGERHRLQAG